MLNNHKPIKALIRPMKLNPMKKQLFFALALFFTIGISSCKKETEANKPLREKALGRWELVKTETTLAGTVPVVVNYTSADYYDFKAGEEDILERKMNGNTQYGNYVFVVGDQFNITIDGKLYSCSPTALDASKFEFTAKEGNTTTKVFLKR